MRLQPISKVGVSFSRSTGSLTCFLRLPSAIRLAGAAIFGWNVKAGT